MALGSTQPVTERSVNNIALGGGGGKGGQCLGLTILPSSCAHYLETWESQPPGTFRSCPDLYRDCFTLMIVVISHIFRPDNMQNEFINKY